MILPVVLCGGSGTRLWPLSRKDLPKQFVNLFDNQTLFSRTLERLRSLFTSNVEDSIAQQLVCVASESHRFLVAQEAADIFGTSRTPKGPQISVLLEPQPKNTAAAMALVASRFCGSDVLLFCPADHYIPDSEKFKTTIYKGEEMARGGSIVLFGIQPHSPATGYGYIETQGDNVLSFTEKPSLDTAKAMIQAGGFFWNSGIFMCRADVLLEAFERHAPDILDLCQRAMAQAQTEVFSDIHFIRPHAEIFSGVRSQSIDYAVMENHAGLKLIPFEGRWSDVGSWSSVAELISPDEDGNQKIGSSIFIESKNTMVYGQQRVVVAVGLDGIVIVDSPDALLVTAKDQSEDVKRAVAALEVTDNRSVVTSHRKVHRPWGWYDSIDRGDRFQVKRISVKPGASLSLQMHNHRAEHWVVVKGTARVTRGKEILLLSENESVYIPIGMSHRLENPGVIDLEIIEIQSGSYLGEDDIIRFDDHYGRS